MPQEDPRFSLPPLTSPSPPPRTSDRRPKRSALEPPAFAQNRSSSPRRYRTSPRQRIATRGTASQSASRPSSVRVDPRPRGEASQEDLAATVGWSPDALNHVFTSSPQADDLTFLNDLADNDFSSPSNYHSFTTSNTSVDPRDLSRTTSGASTSTSISHTTDRILHDLNIMPPTTRRCSSSSSSHNERPAKRSRVDSSLHQAPRQARAGNDDDPFRSSSPTEGHDMIDLTADDGKADLEKVMEEKQREKEENGDLVKLSAFQCVICMDDATNLTVTHCGRCFASLPGQGGRDVDKVNRSSLLRRLPALIAQRRDDEGALPNVPRQAGHKASGAVHEQDQGLLPT